MNTKDRINKLAWKIVKLGYDADSLREQAVVTKGIDAHNQLEIDAEALEHKYFLLRKLLRNEDDAMMIIEFCQYLEDSEC